MKLEFQEVVKLRDLPDMPKEIPALFVPARVPCVLYGLQAFGATTAAGPNGAINVWTDRQGKVRCNAMRHLRDLDNTVCDSQVKLRAWLKQWLKEIQ